MDKNTSGKNIALLELSSTILLLDLDYYCQQINRD